MRADQSIKILLIEDNPGDARLLQETLLEVGSTQFELVHVEQLKQGQTYLDTNPVDVILLDLSLPDSQGIETLIQTQRQASGTPIVVMTGLNDETLAMKALQRGAQDYLVKGQVNGDLLARSIRYAIERKRIEEELRRAATENLRLAQAIDSALDGILITDPGQPDNPVIYTNPAFTKITGYKAEEALGSNCRFLQGPETDRQAVAQMREAIAHQREVKTTVLNYRKDGQAFWNELKIAPVFSEQGQLLYFVGVQRDVTETKRAEEKIRQQAALLDIAADAILVESLDSQITFWNKGAERLYGWSAEEAVGQPARKLLYKQPSSKYREIQQQLIANQDWQGELQQVTRNGQEVLVESRWTLVRDEHGQPKSMLIVSTDITEKKQLEAQFLRAQRMESIGTLAGGIAHDLNNMLSPILMTTQLLRMKVRDEQSLKWLMTLESSTKRAADLVKQVLSFARGLEGKRTVLHLEHVVAEVEQIVRETFPRSIQVHVAIAPEQLWTVMADVTQLHQVLMNLCVNARDAILAGGTINIVADNLLVDEHYARMNIDARVGPYVTVTVSDTGTGIPPEALERIFEPFFTTKEPGKGTGLGLSTVLGIVKNHGGFINVYSEPGRGTQFRVCIPAIATSEVQYFQEEGRRLPCGNGELILVVDDEAAIREITKTSLETYGYQVLTASDGIEAIALYAQHHDQIKVALIDMMMPSMDGATTIQTLHRINPTVKVIAVSGLSSNEQSAIAAGAGVKTFLSKPYTSEKLLTALYDVIHLP